MQVILLDKISNLGKVGDEINVKAGYARNYLIPQGKAVMATPANRADLAAKRAELEKAAEERYKVAVERGEKIAAIGTLEITTTVGNEGRLFGSIGARDIALALAVQDIEVSKSEIRLPEGLIRIVGEYPVVVHLHSEVNIELIVSVKAD